MNETLYLIHGNLITMEEQDLADGYVIIRAGKIEALGNMEDLPEIPLDAGILDAEGSIVTPGLVDAHSHLGMWEDSLDFEGADGNEDTDPVTPQLRALDGVNPQDRAFSEAANAGVTTVITGPGSANPIGGQLLAMKTSGSARTTWSLRNRLELRPLLGKTPNPCITKKIGPIDPDGYRRHHPRGPVQGKGIPCTAGKASGRPGRDGQAGMGFQMRGSAPPSPA